MFTMSDVQTRFMSQYPSGSIAINKKCLVTFSSNSKCYEYTFKNPIDLIRKLNLATETELLQLEGKKRCECGSQEIIKLNEANCWRCAIIQSPEELEAELFA